MGCKHTSTFSQNLLDESISLHVLAIPSPPPAPRLAVLPQPHFLHRLLQLDLVASLQPPLRGLGARDVPQRRVRAEVDFVQLAQRGRLALRQAVFARASRCRSVEAPVAVRGWGCAGVALAATSFSEFGIYVCHPYAR